MFTFPVVVVAGIVVVADVEVVTGVVVPGVVVVGGIVVGVDVNEGVGVTDDVCVGADTDSEPWHPVKGMASAIARRSKILITWRNNIDRFSFLS